MIVVADTSVLLNLCCVEREDLLPGLFKDIVIPPEVAAEFVRLVSNARRFQGLTLPNWILQRSATVVPASLRSMTGLDPGESAALALAVEIRADAILIDERKGHQAASQLGLKAIGILGILIQAKTAGLLPEIRSVIDRLDREAGFWVATELRNRVLKIAGE